MMQDIEKVDLIRMALGPDTLVQNFCQEAKSFLGLSSLNPNSRPINFHIQPLSQSSPRNVEFSRNPNPLFPLATLNANDNFNSSPFPDDSSRDFEQQQMSNQYSFPNNENPFANLHKRSYSASDACLVSAVPGFERPGYRFPQGGLVDDFGSSRGFLSPSERGCVSLQREEMMRLQLENQRMAAAQLMVAYESQLSHEKERNFQLQNRSLRLQLEQQRMAAAAAYGSQMSHEKERNFQLQNRSLRLQLEQQRMAAAAAYESQIQEDLASKRIYLAFPPESSFTDEDVRNYFSNFGEVENVMIPNQEKRTFGFVIFANAETVRIILAQGNTHSIDDSIVLVKPYKSKRQRRVERRNYSPSSTPSGMDLRDQHDCPLGGPRLSSNNRQEIPPNVLQQAIEQEHQRQRLLNLKLPDKKNESIQHHQRSLSIGSPTHFPTSSSHSIVSQSENNIEETTQGEKHLQLVANSSEAQGYDSKRQQQIERRNYSPSSSPSGTDSRDLHDCHLGGPRMSSNNRQEMLRSKAKQPDIFLTFPPESSFTYEDVTNYFSNFGEVEAVKIPYQENRTYGFVTLANAETVRIILDQENPHLIGDSMVLVKPYENKEKIPQKQDMLRRKPNQRDVFQEAIEVALKRKRLLNLSIVSQSENNIEETTQGEMDTVLDTESDTEQNKAASSDQ